MIIMLNGTFGVGKTTTATALAQRVPGAHLFDPEDVGQFARYLTTGLRRGAEDTDDFQNIRMWPPLTVFTAQQLYQGYARPLIVPMTLVQPVVLEPIRAGFSTIAPVHHFCLVAPLATIQQRLASRGHGPGTWPWRKSTEYARLLETPYYATHLDTERHSTAELVDQIVAQIAA